MKRRRRRHRARVSHERWLVSYADFITILFAFFVVMYSTARIDRKKAVQVSAAIQAAFQHMGAFPGGGVQGGGTSQNAVPQSASPPESLPLPKPPEAQSADAALDALQQELREALAAEISRGEVALQNGPDGLTVSLREVGFFDSGSADIKPGAQLAFSRMASILVSRGHHIRIEGHTDNVPIHTAQFASNWELSTARSTEMIRLLITKYAFSPEMLSAAGYAEYHPIASNDADAGRALNRRVDVVILRESAPMASPKPSPSRSFSPP